MLTESYAAFAAEYAQKDEIHSILSDIPENKAEAIIRERRMGVALFKLEFGNWFETRVQAIKEAIADYKTKITTNSDTNT